MAATSKSEVKFSSVVFQNYKTFSDYTIRLGATNLLVGPNNSGKSTIVGAFRALSVGLRRANAKSPVRVKGPEGDRQLGYVLSSETLGISVENAHTDFSSANTLITFNLTNGHDLQLFFPEEGGCNLLYSARGRPITSPSAFRRHFPVSVYVIPILGPLEQEEIKLQRETVLRELATTRASRHFRNYWSYFPEGFESFARLVTETWPGMEVEEPEYDHRSGKLTMFCKEQRLTRELFWSGFGFQIWCQLLTHFAKASDSTVLAVDEPEVYLHPDVQRQLLDILKGLGPSIIAATHSTEIISQADPNEIILVDKTVRSSRRLRDIAEVQHVLTLVGSVHNITLTRLAESGRVLFVEGVTDFPLLARFARRCGFSKLASQSDITAVDSGGFSAWEKIAGAGWFFGKALKGALKLGALFDRDYGPDSMIFDIEVKLREGLDFVHFLRRKELENYLLVPAVLQRATDIAIKQRGKLPTTINVEKLLGNIVDEFRMVVQSKYISNSLSYLMQTEKRIDQSTHIERLTKEFEARWKNKEERLSLVPGKQVLARLREGIHTNCKVNLTDAQIVSAFNSDEIPLDLLELLQGLNEFRAA